MTDSTRLEEEFLVCEALGIDRSDLILNPELSKSDNPKLQEFKKRSNNNEPLAYITGYQPFMGLDFIVDQNVLIPRPETELLVEEAIKICKRNSRFDIRYSIDYSRLSIIDIGTGSGAIAVTLAKLIPNATVVATDISSEAIEIAKNNANKHGVSVSFRKGTLFEPLKEEKFDVIVSNPPYIPTDDIQSLEPNVKGFEPILALDGGKDGLDIIRKLISEAKHYLKPNGYLLFEFGFGQSEAIEKLLKHHNYSNIEIIQDYASIPRIALANFS